MVRSELIIQFRAYQEKAVRLMASGERMLNAGDTRDLAGLSIVRWELIQLLRQYQAFKNREIYDPAIANENDLERQLAQLMKNKCLAIEDEFRAHVIRWNGSTEVQWVDYRLAALAMREKLLRHLDDEHTGIKRLLHWDDVH